MVTEKMSMGHRLRTHAETKFPHQKSWKFFLTSRKRILLAMQIRFGSVFNSPFQISLQEKNNAKIFFSFSQLS
jgi:hypothetical protein